MCLIIYANISRNIMNAKKEDFIEIFTQKSCNYDGMSQHCCKHRIIIRYIHITFSHKHRHFQVDDYFSRSLFNVRMFHKETDENILYQ